MSPATPSGAADCSTVPAALEQAAAEPLGPGYGPTGVAASAHDARATVPQASASVQSDDAVVGKRLSIKMSLHGDRSLAAPPGGVHVPERASQRPLGPAGKLIILVAGLVMLTLLLAGGYRTIAPEHMRTGSPTTLRANPAMLERATTPPGTAQSVGTVSQPATTSEPPPMQVVAPAASLPAMSPAPPPAPVAVVPTGTVLAPASAPIPTAALAPPKTAGAHDKATVQLATVFSRKAVTYEWQRLQKLLPGLLGNRDLVVSKRHRGGRTRWLVRTSGFDNSGQAAEFCQLVHAKGFHCQVITAK